ncbi:GSCFA domain-containing protein [Rhizobium alvei]|uniref:GSCFA domain-containing protein n=1 Tax=Rhizobium alvei TaxID=1132659 RepID=A0ABT8YLB2_9HYPH|nr:GSCFA domain-containing protein [Rhizobium alvei]MDO6964490.1 GSCFA domain-containing protein [Rhizobium alvei]
MANPYSKLDSSKYWRSGVADVHAVNMKRLYKKKFDIDFDANIATAGSCFAQHVARSLRKNGYRTIDMEPVPAWVDAGLASDFGYGIYSARYGNLYTARQLLQLIEDCETGTVRETDVWEKNGRYYDALRPAVEPEGLDTIEEVLEHRKYHLGLVSQMFAKTDVLIFTLGLTETWERIDNGIVYPTCPGVIAGEFDPAIFRFRNLKFSDVHGDMVKVREKLLAINPNMRFILTVSPVPLTATASENHVLVATMRSKSLLRTVCTELSEEFDNVDYFPSYEIIMAPNVRSYFFEPNLRSVNPTGVETVMASFFAEHPARAGAAEPVAEDGVQAGSDEASEGGKRKGSGMRARRRSKDDVVCEEALLEAFGQ